MVCPWEGIDAIVELADMDWEGINGEVMNF